MVKMVGANINLFCRKKQQKNEQLCQFSSEYLGIMLCFMYIHCDTYTSYVFVRCSNWMSLRVVFFIGLEITFAYNLQFA